VSEDVQRRNWPGGVIVTSVVPLRLMRGRLGDTPTRVIVLLAGNRVNSERHAFAVDSAEKV